MVTYEFHDKIAMLRMDDGKANALNGNSLTALEEALEATASARALVLAGRAGFFSGGLDLKNLPTLPVPELRAVLEQFVRVLRRLVDSPAPIVAALSGHAMAGGAVLCLACDYAVAMRGSFKVGLNEAAIGIPLPPVVIELGRAKLMPHAWVRAMAHGEVFSLEEALRMGFIDELVETGELESRAVSRAQALAKLPTESYLATKRHIRREVLARSGEETVAPLVEHFLTLAAQARQ